jgi:hypothetical protein
MESTRHISFETLTHPDAKADFQSVAPTRKELKQNLAVTRDLWRCTSCAARGTNNGLKVCSGVSFLVPVKNESPPSQRGIS